MSSGPGMKKLCSFSPRALALATLCAVVLFPTFEGRSQEPGAFAAAGEERGMELQRYRDAVRRHFVLKQYKELLELTEKYGHLYPEDEGTEFYRTQAEIRIEEAEKKIPFARLEDKDFKIPVAPEGAPSLLEELRNKEAQAAAEPGDLGLEPAPGSEIAMGTAPLEGIAPSASDEAAPAPVEPAPVDATPVPERRLPADLAEPAEVAEPAEAEGSSPLLMILGACAAVLGLVAVALLVGLVRRGRAKGPAAAEPAVTADEPEGPPAPPLFNFEDAVEQPGPLGDTFGATELGGTEMPQPFSETATPEGAPAEFAEVSDFGEASAPGFDAPASLGETRSGDVNQEISDLLYSPGTVEDSVFDALPGRHEEIPAPLGETRTDQAVFGQSGPDNSDLVQLPDEDVFNLSSASDAEVDSLFAGASEGSARPAVPEPAPASASASDLSSIDLFGDQPPAVSEVKGSTTRVGLEEVDEAFQSSADSSPAAPPMDETRAVAPDEGFMDIPFALEDPFQNLSGKKAEETAFNTSTAEAMAAGAEAETGAEARELLQIMEEGEGGPEAADDLWSSATVAGPGDASGRSPAPGESESVVAFQEDETAVVEFDDGGTGELPTGASAPGISEPEAETVARGIASETGQQDLPDEPFERERQRGKDALQQEDWGKAVYHLSIAATLRPEAQDVREDLRRARKMKKEQQTG